MPDLKARLEAKYKRALASSGKAKAAGRYVIETSEGTRYLPSRQGKEFSSLARSLDLVGTTGKRVTLHDLRTPTLPSSSPAGSTSRRSRRSWATLTRR